MEDQNKKNRGQGQGQEQGQNRPGQDNWQGGEDTGQTGDQQQDQ